MTKTRRDIKVGKHFIGDRFPVFVIAETGTNHNGNIEVAIKMIEEARRCGADAVKFQTIDADASYIKGTAPYNIYRRIRFTINDWNRLKRAAFQNNILFFSAPADIPSVEVFKSVKTPLIKISSGSMTNIALARKIAELKIPVMVSTGMSYLSEVRQTVSELEKRGIDDIIILHCTSLYPARCNQLNLKAIETLSSIFSYPIGYSDHTTSDFPSIIAVSLGARIVEKHFTIDRRLGGPEQELSYVPKELKRWIRGIRDTEEMLGNFKKVPSQEELKVRDRCRRCLVANIDIKAGQVITEDMIGMKRPLAKPGLNTSYFKKLIQKKAKKAIKKGSPIYSGCV